MSDAANCNPINLATDNTSATAAAAIVCGTVSKGQIDVTQAPTESPTPKKDLIFLPEGSTIQVRKPEIWIEFLPVSSLVGETVPRRFKPSDNIPSIKGLAIDRVKDRLGENALMDFEKIAVMHDNRKLNDDQMLVDFAFPEYKTLTVCYPEDGMTFRQRRASVELEVDFFALFEEE